MQVGIIADDLTGATDVAAAVAERGIATALVIGVPAEPVRQHADVVVVALKTRTMDVNLAREQVRATAAWLRASGATRLYDKYCSTFDSTAQGNIGPIADELLGLAEKDTPGSWTVHCPSYPANARTVYQGHLFVGSTLLNESGMQNHPLTPMTDANLVRVLQAQTPRPVGLAAIGTGDVADRLARAVAAGAVHVIADALDDADIDALARACADRPVLAGGAPFGAAMAAQAVASAVQAAAGAAAPPVDVPEGPGAIVVGSASRATLAQVQRFAQTHQVFSFTPTDIEEPGHLQRLTARATAALGDEPVMIAVDSTPAAVAAAQAALGVAAASQLVESCLARIAAELVQAGARRLVVAGGETSGAVAHRLGVRQVGIGPVICPGVPWTVSAEPELAVAFKSGNFGGVDFFTDAFAVLGADATRRRAGVAEAPGFEPGMGLRPKPH